MCITLSNSAAKVHRKSARTISIPEQDFSKEAAYQRVVEVSVGQSVSHWTLRKWGRFENSQSVRALVCLSQAFVPIFKKLNS